MNDFFSLKESVAKIFRNGRRENLIKQKTFKGKNSQTRKRPKSHCSLLTSSTTRISYQTRPKIDCQTHLEPLETQKPPLYSRDYKANDMSNVI